MCTKQESTWGAPAILAVPVVLALLVQSHHLNGTALEPVVAPTETSSLHVEGHSSPQGAHPDSRPCAVERAAAHAPVDRAPARHAPPGPTTVENPQAAHTAAEHAPGMACDDPSHTGSTAAHVSVSTPGPDNGARTTSAASPHPESASTDGNPCDDQPAPGGGSASASSNSSQGPGHDRHPVSGSGTSNTPRSVGSDGVTPQGDPPHGRPGDGPGAPEEPWASVGELPFSGLPPQWPGGGPGASEGPSGPGGQPPSGASPPHGPGNETEGPDQTGGPTLPFVEEDVPDVSDVPNEETHSVPEPSSWLLFGVTLAGAGLRRWRSRSAASLAAKGAQFPVPS